MKSDNKSSEYKEIDRWEKGVGWIAHPDETMQRASHAFKTGEDIWLVDPVDTEGIDDLINSLEGEIAGVVVLLDRHKRDSDAFAERYGVDVYAPEWVKVDEDLESNVVYFEDELEDTGYRAIEIIDNRFWKEGGLYNEKTGTLYVPEALGNAGYFTTKKERIGVHPALRLKPPRSLGKHTPERIMVGHGPGISDDVSEAMRDALSGSRKRTPRLYAGNFRKMLPV